MCSLSSEEGGCENDGVTGAEDPKGEAPSYCAAGAAAGGGRCKLGTAAVAAGMPSYRSWREARACGGASAADNFFPMMQL